MKKILAHLRDYPSGRIQCWVVDPAGQAQEIFLSIEQITATGAAEVVAVVPATKLSWHKVQVPAGVFKYSEKKQQTVLQALLEDSLLDASENMHISVEPTPDSSDLTLVNICDKNWLAAWLNKFEQANVSVSRIIPEVYPELLQDKALCTGDSEIGWFSFNEEGIVVTLPLMGNMRDLGAPSKALSLADTYQDAAQLFEGSNVELIELKKLAGTLLQSKWELAQGEFSLSRMVKVQRRVVSQVVDLLYGPRWTAARYAAIVGCALLVVGMNTQNILSTTSLAHKQQAINALVTQTFPNVTIVIDPHVQMRRELTTLRQRAGFQSESDMLPMTAAAGKAMQTIPQRPKSITYSGTYLDLIGMDANHVDAMNKGFYGTSYVAAPVKGSDVIRVSVGG